MSKTFDTLAELAACVGQEVAVTDWFTVTQQHIDQFADATGDHQWIHVDPERAKAGPFGATIAHGYLTLSLLAGFLDAASFEVRGVSMGINYGLNKVRFMAPVPVGSRLRARMRLLEAAPIQGGLQLTWQSTIEREGSDKPVCVAEPLAQYFI
jgi:acyl dehydratase